MLKNTMFLIVCFALQNWSTDAKGSFAAICDVLIAEVLSELKEHYEGASVGSVASNNIIFSA
jgi:hypothetical protein